MEAALVFREVEERQVFDFCVGVVTDALVPYSPVATLLFPSIVQMGLEFFGSLLREYLVVFEWDVSELVRPSYSSVLP